LEAHIISAFDKPGNGESLPGPLDDGKERSQCEDGRHEDVDEQDGIIEDLKVKMGDMKMRMDEKDGDIEV
jgi:hypothetical protein